MPAPPTPVSPRSQSATSTGLIVLDHRDRPVYFNAEASKVLLYPRGSTNPSNLADLFPLEIRRALATRSLAKVVRYEDIFKSGKRTYRYSICPLISKAKDSMKATTAILIDRVSSKPANANVAEMAKEFHLTGREQQTVQFLTEGLTSKEIAARMKISPNTVKTFMHMIMAKMAVPTRSAIIGRLLRT